MNGVGFVFGCIILLIYLYVTDLIDLIKDKRQISASKHILGYVSKNETSEIIVSVKSK